MPYARRLKSLNQSFFTLKKITENLHQKKKEFFPSNRVILIRVVKLQQTFFLSFYFSITVAFVSYLSTTNFKIKSVDVKTTAKGIDKIKIIQNKGKAKSKNFAKTKQANSYL